jgi:hypothetical protein
MLSIKFIIFEIFPGKIREKKGERLHAKCTPVTRSVVTFNALHCAQHGGWRGGARQASLEAFFVVKLAGVRQHHRAHFRVR